MSEAFHTDMLANLVTPEMTVDTLKALAPAILTIEELEQGRVHFTVRDGRPGPPRTVLVNGRPVQGPTRLLNEEGQRPPVISLAPAGLEEVAELTVAQEAVFDAIDVAAVKKVAESTQPIAVYVDPALLEAQAAAEQERHLEAIRVRLQSLTDVNVLFLHTDLRDLADYAARGLPVLQIVPATDQEPTGWTVALTHLDGQRLPVSALPPLILLGIGQMHMPQPLPPVDATPYLGLDGVMLQKVWEELSRRFA